MLQRIDRWLPQKQMPSLATQAMFKGVPKAKGERRWRGAAKTKEKPWPSSFVWPVSSHTALHTSEQIKPSSRAVRRNEHTRSAIMDRFLVASLLVLLASAAAVEGRVVRSVFDDDTPRNSSGARELIGQDPCQLTCNQVRFKAMCRSLTKLPDVTNPRQLLLASLRAATSKAKEAKARVDAYAARSHPAGPMVSIIDSCRSGYDGVVASLEETRQLVDTPGSSYDDLNRKASDALTSASDCDNAFDDFPDVPSPFAGVQKNVFRLVDNVLNIAAAVHQPAPRLPAVHGPHLH